LISKIESTDEVRSLSETDKEHICQGGAFFDECSNLLKKRQDLQSALRAALAGGNDQSTALPTPIDDFGPVPVPLLTLAKDSILYKVITGAYRDETNTYTDDMSLGELKRHITVIRNIRRVVENRLSSDQLWRKTFSLRLRMLDEQALATRVKADQQEKLTRATIEQVSDSNRKLIENTQHIAALLETHDGATPMSKIIEVFSKADNQVFTVIAGTSLPSPRITTAVLPAFDRSRDRPSLPKLVKVFYATERQRDQSQGQVVFLNRPSSNEPLHFGIASVTIPPNHVMGMIEEPVWYKFERRPDRQKHFTLALKDTDEKQFYGAIRQHLSQFSENREVFVFVHGFNNSFEDVVLRTAQIAYDIGFQGAPIVYDWPSHASVLDYTDDKTAMLGSWRNLETFLTTLADKTGANTINVIAHSMGNYATLLALDDAVARQRKLHINQLILAAPDVDKVPMQQMMPEIVKARVANRITMYTSHSDLALIASKWKNGVPAIGGSSPVWCLPGVDSIDAAPIEGTVLGHDYFATTRAVLSDLFTLITSGSNLPRAGLEEVSIGESHYWAFRPSKY
jgi:esterase/lipase superfamily enzyme